MNTVKRGRFITLEGIEGVGKTTNLAHIRTLLETAGLEVDVTREPGGTGRAEQMRQLVLTPMEEPVTGTAEVLMMFAARSQHLEHRIRPALERGCWVLCDRFTDASRAYQGFGRGLPLERIEHLADWVQQGLTPDLTLLLDADPDVSDLRRRGRTEADRFEQERRDFFERVRAGYLSLAKTFPERIIIIDAAQSMEAVKLAIQAVITDRFPEITL